MRAAAGVAEAGVGEVAGARAVDEERSALDRLSELAPGRLAVVESLDASDPIGRRLLDLGLLPGTRVRALRKAPLGDPAVFELRGYRLCLRESESQRVRVRAHDPAEALPKS